MRAATFAVWHALLVILPRQATCFHIDGVSLFRQTSHLLFMAEPCETDDSLIDVSLSRTAFLTSFMAAAIPVSAATAVPKPATAAAQEEEPQQLWQQLQQRQVKVVREESVSGFVAGALLTLTKTLVKYPLDSATVRLQMVNSSYSILDPIALFRDSYIGFAAPLLVNIPAGALFFAVKDAVQASLEPDNDNDSLFQSGWFRTCLAVAVAQIPYWAIRNPSEVVKTRQQAGLPNYGNSSSVLDAYRQVRYDRMFQPSTTFNSSSTSSNHLTAAAAGGGGGWDAYYTGYWENVIYTYQADVLKFLCYEQLTAINNVGPRHRQTLSPFEGAVAGALATAMAQLVTTPLDVVRNRVMAQKQQGNTLLNKSTTTTTNTKEENYLECLVQLAKQEGWKGLFAGATPRVGKALLSGAIQFATYEETKQEIAKFFRTKK